MKEYIYTFSKFIALISLLFFFGFVFGFLYYILLIYIVIKLTEKIFSLEFIAGEDLLFTCEYEKCPNTIIISALIEKISLEEFKVIFLEKVLKKFNRINQSIKTVFTFCYWETHKWEISLKNIKPLKILFNKENDKNFNNFNVDIDNQKLIQKFIEKKFSTNLKDDKPLWRIYYSENFEENKSLFILKFHHSIGDGSALLNILSNLNNEANIRENYNNVKNNTYKKIGFLKKIMMILFSPIATSLVLPKQPHKNFINPLKRKIGKPSGENWIAKSDDIDIDHLKMKIKSIHGISKITINDFLVYIINKSIKNYVDDEESEKDDKSSKNYEKLDNQYKNNLYEEFKKDENKKNLVENNQLQKDYKKITLFALLAVSFRFELKENELGNKAVARLIEFDMDYNSKDCKKEDIKEIIKICELNRKIKNREVVASSAYFGALVISQLMNKSLFLKSGEASTNHITYIFTNIRGINSSTDINGKKIINLSCYVPHGLLPFSFLAVSYNNRLTLSVNTDKSYGIDVEKLMNYINKNIQIFIDHY